jgi:hypothetical protein
VQPSNVSEEFLQEKTKEISFWSSFFYPHLHNLTTQEFTIMNLLNFGQSD